jgi:light-regulated signal transduction histidine kinase (bacteriophytochrome)/CheY-like chemotaxis protein
VSPREPVNLTNCDEEPIHVPGSIQPHGVLIACDSELTVVRRASVNAAGQLGLNGSPVGRRLEEVMDRVAIHRLRNALATSANASRPAAVTDMSVNAGRVFDAAIHRQGADVVIELEPAQGAGQPLQIAREIIGRIGELDDVDRLIAYTTRLIAAVLDYDRVMIYRFEEDGSGKVLSEAKRSHLESFLGQYFPATDIPQQARELYLRNTIRIIGDAACIRVPIEPELDAAGRPLDLSHAHLRSVSPIHCEYLRNMGVSASMSISIVVDGSLWGLIACHHYAPKVLPMAQRLAMEMFGGFFSLQLKALIERSRISAAEEARHGLDRLLRGAHDHADAGTLLRESLPDFARLVPNDGVGLWIDGEWTAQGSVPPAETLRDWVALLDTVAGGRVWASHSLAEHLPGAESYSADAAGMLAVPLSLSGSTYLLFFRRELIHTLDWAGNPEKSYEVGPLGDRLTPRKSFAIWKETVRHKSKPWTEADRGMADATRAALVEIVLRHHEQMTDERRKADVRQRMLNEELTHRVKNILAVIKSLVASPQGDRQTIEGYVSALQGRIKALSFAHDQIVRGGGGGLLGDLLGAELSPYRANVASVVAEGPRVWLDGRAFSVMALVLHEMATNAAKYGALSSKHGRLSVAWNLDGSGACEILWSEEGGPPVAPPSRTGFGSALTQRSIPFDLGGASEIAFEPSGVRARFLIPATHVAATVRMEDSRPAAASGGDAPARLRRLNPAILIVEDQLLIAMDLEADLEEAGLRVLAIASSVSQGMDALEKARPDLAILDVNLGNETSLPLAAELRRRCIPFIFATGYGDGGALPAEYAGVPVVRKPYDRGAIADALVRVATENAAPGAFRPSASGERQSPAL